MPIDGCFYTKCQYHECILSFKARVAPLGIEPIILAVLVPCTTHWATEPTRKTDKHTYIHTVHSLTHSCVQGYSVQWAREHIPQPSTLCPTPTPIIQQPHLNLQPPLVSSQTPGSKASKCLRELSLGAPPRTSTFSPTVNTSVYILVRISPGP